MEIDLKGKINGLYNQVTQEAKSRDYRAANAIRSASLEVLRGERSGKIYRKPFTKKATYQASAPGEPPAVRSGTLRRSWYTRLSDQNGPAARLARYGNAPAIFYQTAPEDTAAGWDGKRQYGDKNEYEDGGTEDEEDE